MTRMFRTTDVVLIAAMVAAAGFTYKTKHDAEQQLNRISKIERQIRYEEDSIDLLKADWSLLTQPARLQRLAESYQDQLKLQSVQPRQIAGLEAVPLKPPPAPLDVKEASAAPKDAIKDLLLLDPTATGDIGR
ncbi:MAG: hypothetical protein INR68_10945 [Methylobacterium mesophilicum]|nr:hypothetical protein [Methylobacterium mesophilicum]